jgi:phosphoglycolate phosphatase
VKPLVLFDVDGTLLLTGGAGLRAFERAAVELFGDRGWFVGIETAGGLDPLIFAEAASRRGLGDVALRHREFREAYLRILPDELARGGETVRALPGVVDSLERLRAAGLATLGLLTGNYAPAIPIKLEAVGIDPGWFEVTVCGEDAPTRPALVPVAIERCALRGPRVEAERILVVGDTPKDVHCARENGARALGVATGKYSVEELRTAGADVAVEDLRDPGPLFDLLESLVGR